ncbi:MAG: pirin family protein [Gammaproteobacteria bacterium]|nr:pirin family protein [Pseudomonadales bacterium]MCP5348216.1 pirin family protein [Pseudomonadales bacterium]
MQATPASDGDGVRLLRVFGGNNLARFDPFLMLDEFGSTEPRDYIGGFPPHPHRGFETVTYMLEGKMEHRDHMNNIGLLDAGDVQWMKAGAGVIHSEMPRQEEGRMRGFQLWVNLPAAEKMTAASYRDIAAADIPAYNLDGVQIKAIAGTLQVNGKELTGAVQGNSTQPAYLDIHAGTEATELVAVIPESHTALIYVYEGKVAIGDQRTGIQARQLARLSPGQQLRLSLEAASRVLLIAGKPLGEPIVHYGPFVMNSRAEIEQAIADYNAGRLVG